MKNLIGLKEFRQNVESYSKKIAKGESFIVLRKSKPLFKVVPVSESEIWEPVIDFTEINKQGVLIEDIVAAVSHGQNSKSDRKTAKKLSS